MSLLQEALKRKEQDESQRKLEAEGAENISPAGNANLPGAGQQAAEAIKTGVPPDSPSQSMPVAEQTQAAVSQSILAAAEPLARSEASERAKTGHRNTPFLWIIVAALAVFIGLTITAGIAFFFYRGASPVKVKTVQQAGHIDNTPSVITGKTEILAGGLISVPKPESTGRMETAAHQSGAADAKKEASSAGAQNTETSSVRQQSADNTGNKPPAAIPFFFKPKAPPPVSQSVRWPVLKLTGILRGAGEAESTAFINGKMISAGQTIAGVTIVEIQADGVILKYGNEKRFLRVGATSY